MIAYFSKISIFFLDKKEKTYYNEDGEQKNMNIESEQLFLSLFGLKVTPSENGYIILDEFDMQVGQINILDEDTYQVEVLTYLIEYNMVKYPESSSIYEFNLHHQEEKMRTSISIGKKSELKIRSETLGNIHFCIDKDGFVIEFNTPGQIQTITEKLEIKRTPYLRKNDERYEKSYSYYIRTKRNRGLESIALETIFNRSPKEEAGLLKIREIKYRNDAIATVTSKKVYDDFTRVINNHQEGKDALKRFMQLIENFLPTNPGIIAFLTWKIDDLWEELMPFLPPSSEGLRENHLNSVNK